MKLEILGALGVVAVACIPTQTAKTALEVAQVTCAIAHATMTVAEVQRACDIADALIPDLEKILAEERAQRKAGCPK